MSRRFAVYGLGALALGLSAWVVVERGEAAAQPSAQAGDATSVEVAALRREVAALRSESRREREQAERVLVTADSAPALAEGGPATTPPPAQPASPTEVVRERAERAREVQRAAVTSLEARFTGEELDTAWSTDTERQIKGVVGATLGAKLEEVECASTLCRVVVSHGSRQDQRNLAEIRTHEPFQQGIYFDYDYDALKTTMFVLRRGHSFREDSENTGAAPE
jgi:hypothetical protein